MNRSMELSIDGEAINPSDFSMTRHWIRWTENGAEKGSRIPTDLTLEGTLRVHLILADYDEDGGITWTRVKGSASRIEIGPTDFLGGHTLTIDGMELVPNEGFHLWAVPTNQKLQRITELLEEYEERAS